MSDDDSAACPLPLSGYDHIVLGHGGGGKLSADLLRSVFLPQLDDPLLAELEDSAVLEPEVGRLAFTTDAFVVRPSFFPGGDVGRLAVCGTVNDLTCVGATPRYLSAAFVLEEGLSISELSRAVASMRAAAIEAKVRVVTGDTKVVERGSGDGIYIVTSGLGFVPAGRSLSVSAARPGDHVLVSGTLGDHGIAVLSARDGLELETSVKSDCAPLAELAAALLAAAPETRALRDPTRGGLVSSLHEIARASGVGVQLEEGLIPIHPEVHAACELLGFEPLHVANEGKLVAVVPGEQCGAARAALRGHPLGTRAACIGHVIEQPRGFVTLRSRIGGTRVLTEISGEQLPRIC